MIHHQNLPDSPFLRTKEVLALIKKGEITLAGNTRLKIYGSLSCTSGKRMKISNRVFFKSQKEAVSAGHRPCGHCMKEEYDAWKKAGSITGITGEL